MKPLESAFEFKFKITLATYDRSDDRIVLYRSWWAKSDKDRDMALFGLGQELHEWWNRGCVVLSIEEGSSQHT